MPIVNRIPPKKLQPSNFLGAFFIPICANLPMQLVLLRLALFVVISVFTSFVVIVDVFLLVSVVVSVTGFIVVVVVELYEDKKRAHYEK